MNSKFKVGDKVTLSPNHPSFGKFQNEFGIGPWIIDSVRTYSFDTLYKLKNKNSEYLKWGGVGDPFSFYGDEICRV